MEDFRGFPDEGLRFLRDLKRHNDRDWFRERKHLYQQFVEQPMALLVTHASAACRRHGLKVGAKEKSPVMRVYRDIRFSPDKKPFKTHVAASLHGLQGMGVVYIHISPEQSFLGSGFWTPERPFLEVWRKAMAADSKAFLRVVKSLAKHGLEFSQEDLLTRLPRGYDQHAGSDIEEYLKLTSYVVSRILKPAEYQSPQLLESVLDFAIASRPLLEYGWALNYAPRKDILEER